MFSRTHPCWHSIYRSMMIELTTKFIYSIRRFLMAINEWIIGPTFSQTRRERKLNFMLDDDRSCAFSTSTNYRIIMTICVDVVPIHWLSLASSSPTRESGHQRLFIIWWWIYHNNRQWLFDWVVKNVSRERRDIIIVSVRFFLPWRFSCFSGIFAQRLNVCCERVKAATTSLQFWNFAHQRERKSARSAREHLERAV